MNIKKENKVLTQIVVQNLDQLYKIKCQILLIKIIYQNFKYQKIKLIINYKNMYQKKFNFILMKQ